MTAPDHATDQPSPEIGHNRAGLAGDALRTYAHRVERVREEIDGLRSDVAQIYAEFATQPGLGERDPQSSAPGHYR